MLEVENLSKSYGSVRALKAVDLRIAPGEIVGLLGPNGAGKTTLVSIVAGLRRPDAGTVRVGPVDAIARPQEARRYIGFAPQDLGIYPIVTVSQNLRLFGELAGLSGRELSAEVSAVAEALQIVDLLDRQAGTLSGGQKRRLHTALAIMNRPPLLLLDEATTGADVGMRADILELMQDLAQNGSAILYSTHYLQEVEALDASVVILEDGEAIGSGTVRDLIATRSVRAIELTYEGPAPHLDLREQVVRDGSVLRVISDEPATALANTLAALGPDANRLRSVEIIEPSLESVYLTLTGHRYRGDQEPTEEGEDVLAT